MLEGKTKVCSKCKIEKELTEYHKQKNKPLGVRSHCKKCRKKHYEDNAEKRRAEAKKHYWENAEKIKQEKKEWRENNPEKAKAKDKKGYAKNKEAIKRRSKKWRKENPEWVKTYHKRWRTENPDKVRIYGQRRRALLLEATIENFTDQDLFDYWEENGINDKECFYCKKEMPNRPETWDHYIALKKGGPHERANLLPCCLSCNSKKWKHDPEVFMEELKNGV